MSWQSLGAVTPKEKEWLDYAPTTQAPDSAVEAVAYRITGLNVDTFDPDRFYALIRFRYGQSIYSPAIRHTPNGSPSVVQVSVPLEISTFPFSWVPQIQLVYTNSNNRPRPVSWAVQIDEFLAPDIEAISLANLSRFLY